MSSHYETLGVSKSASPAEIKKAFRILAMKYHPDRPGGDSAKFKEINAAHEVLSDPVKRQKYDIRFVQPQESMSFFDEVVKATFSKVFRGMSSVINMDIPVEIHVTLEQLCQEKDVVIEYDCEVTCEICKKNNAPIRCHCKGAYGSQCTMCRGHAKYYSCSKCQYGIMTRKKKHTLTLCPYLHHNYSTVTIKDVGCDYPFVKGRKGSLRVKVIYERDPVFEERDGDLLYKMDLTLKESLCGFRKNIKHPKGTNLTISCENVTAPNSTGDYEGYGVNTGKRLIIYYNVLFPKKISSERKELLSTLLN